MPVVYALYLYSLIDLHEQTSVFIAGPIGVDKSLLPAGDEKCSQMFALHYDKVEWRLSARFRVWLQKAL